MRIVKSIVFLAALFALSGLQAQTVDKVINGYVKFIGGEKKWKTIKTITTSGEYDYGGMKFPFTTYAKAPNLYKFIVPLNGKYFGQGYDGTKGWKIDTFKGETAPTPLTGKDALSMANEADVALEDAFIRYQEKGHRATLEGKDTIQNKVCFKVKLIRKNGEQETYYFDQQTYQIVVKEAVSKNVEMEGEIMKTTFSDYRDVEGIKIPFQSVSESSGQTILTITIGKVVLNTPIEDKEFQNP